MTSAPRGYKIARMPEPRRIATLLAFVNQLEATAPDYALGVLDSARCATWMPPRHGLGGCRDEDVRLQRDQLGGQIGGVVELISVCAVVGDQVLALNPACFPGVRRRQHRRGKCSTEDRSTNSVCAQPWDRWRTAAGHRRSPMPAGPSRLPAPPSRPPTPADSGQSFHPLGALRRYVGRDGGLRQCSIGKGAKKRLDGLPGTTVKRMFVGGTQRASPLSSFKRVL